MKLIYKWNHENVETDTEFYFDVSPDGVCTICFNGSDHPKKSPIDWIANLSAFTVLKNDFGYWYSVHYGFHKKWESVKPLINKLIREAHRTTGIKILKISGYSQGAAIATLCHHWIRLWSPFPVVTVIAGSPRVFGLIGLNTSRRMCQGITRLTYGRDIADGLPFYLYHVGTEVHSGRDGFWLWDIKGAIEDHKLKNNNYTQEIEKY